MAIDPLAHRLLDGYQRDFPLEEQPFARIAADLGLSETDVLDRLGRLHETGTISRIGAVVRPNTIGASTLAALSVPPDDLAQVAAMVCAHPEINHCYEREHEINLWFVVTAADAQRLQWVLQAIEAETGFPCLDLPLVEAYHIDLGFPL